MFSSEAVVQDFERRRRYSLECCTCGRRLEDDGFVLDCYATHPPALLRSVYVTRGFPLDEDCSGVFRYRQWLPIVRTLPEQGRSVCFQSKALCHALGLPNLWVLFSGYWPERDAYLPTGTFKDLEALAVLARLPENDKRTLVIASAGNAAAAFAHLCSEQGRSCLVIVPGRVKESLVQRGVVGRSVKVVALAGATYDDAIAFSKRIARQRGFVAEGGIRNVARRDGLGTGLLVAVESMGSLPDYYFQAIGSGAGAIAVHHTASRIVACSSRHGEKVPQLMLSQNAPFTPIYDAWSSGSTDVDLVSDDEYRRRTDGMCAFALSNRYPAYALGGGLYEALRESGGEVLVATNEMARQAFDMFAELENIDISMEAAVALATLVAQCKAKRMEPEAKILLHVTGGGKARLNGRSGNAEGSLTLEPLEWRTRAGLNRTEELFQ